ncbi:MAG: adenylyltransferase/cytidyltransferase family protein [Lachnospiraceae bacterium]|nr:adenylyltransferase/cytidyltransferase family protein [Lachnospiraceae bacterium]
MIIGYTTGVFDLFHVGHLNMLKNAKSMCDKLIVGVTTDELVSYKHKKAVISFDERMEIVRNIRCVDAVVPQDTMNKFEMWKKLKFDIMFVGDDWYGTDKWKAYDEQFQEVGVKIIYFPYYKGTSSTLINQTLMNLRNSGSLEYIK